ncbi:MAG: hypothetical protein WEE89_14200 [Gemmatimonadota bacterium]
MHTSRGALLVLFSLLPSTIGGQVVARATVWAVLAERDLVLEGTAWDPGTQSVVVGSLHKNKIVAIAADGTVRDRVAARSHGLGSVAGIHVDSLRGVLWVTSNRRFDVPSDTTVSALYAFDAATGAFRARYPVSAAGTHFFNDITTAPDGTVYLTDSSAARVWVLRPSAVRLEVLAVSAPFRSPNGITISGDGSQLFIADRDHIRVVSSSDAQSWRLSVPDSIDITGIDGLAFADGALIAHHPGNNARVARYPLGASQRAIVGRELIVANPEDLRTSTTGEVVNGEYVFIGNGQIDRMNAGTIDSATMSPIRLYRVSLRPSETELVAVALSARDSVVLLDAHTLARVATLPVGHNPHEIAAAPDGRRAFIANTGDHSITVIDAVERPRVSATWMLPDSIRVHDVAASADGTLVWTASGEQNLVLGLSAASGTVLQRFPVDRPGGWMLETARPDGTLVIANLEGAAVTLLTPATGIQRSFAARDGEIDAVPTGDARQIWSETSRMATSPCTTRAPARS